jgi:hypothetical protein
VRAGVCGARVRSRNRKIRKFRKGRRPSHDSFRNFLIFLCPLLSTA